MLREIEEYVRGFGLDAYLVGGAVRDELLGLDSKDADFLVLGVDTEQLRAALAAHGRVEDLVVAGRHVFTQPRPMADIGTWQILNAHRTAIRNRSAGGSALHVLQR